ncbi:MAG: sulfur oxidation c-type cytochrome SoxX [Nitrosomonadales bacterium]|nr:sulfur oxidation c-type cytochrome SoxX [Nitrosomonadales bacterium]
MRIDMKIFLPIAVMTVAGLMAVPALAADKTAAELDADAVAIIKRDFRDKGIAKVERVNQDELQAMCTKYLDNPPAKEAERLQAEQEKAIKWPADGKYLGDWKAGEKLAQSGAGMTWSDKPDAPAGGNCYNCHQLSAKEIAYGTIGPSLLHFGKTRGNTEAMQRYVYGRIYNAKAYNLCANMPRFGHMGILSEAQIKDLVALLLDTESIVNK